MKDTGKTTLNQGREQRSGLKAQSTLASTKTVKSKVMELTHGLMARFTKEIG